MSIIYQLAVTPWQVNRYLSEGAEDFCGFALNAASIESVRDADDLRDLLLCKICESDFPANQPLNILKVPLDPFVHARRAVGPLHPDAFMSGVIENAPYDPSGVVGAGGITAELLWIEPGRLTAGSELWRFHSGGTEPELVAVYHGVAWGWEDARTGTFIAADPSKLMGPVVKRDWGTIAVDVETDGVNPTAVTLVAQKKPPEEGFEKLPTGLWTKRIEYHKDLLIYENRLSAVARGVPVRITRLAPSPKGTEALGFALLIDASYAIGNRVFRIAPGAFFCLMPIDEMEKQVRSEGLPYRWDSSHSPAVTMLPSHERSNYDITSLLKDIHALIESIAPEKWNMCTIIVQAVGKQFHYGGNFHIPNSSEDEGDHSGAKETGTESLGGNGKAGQPGDVSGQDGGGKALSGRPSRPVYGGIVEEVSLLPGAILEYVGQIKKLAATPERGAPLAFTLQISALGETKLNVTYEEEPPLIESITPEAWAAEIEEFPRPNPPEWASRFTG